MPRRHDDRQRDRHDRRPGRVRDPSPAAARQVTIGEQQQQEDGRHPQGWRPERAAQRRADVGSGDAIRVQFDPVVGPRDGARECAPSGPDRKQQPADRVIRPAGGDQQTAQREQQQHHASHKRQQEIDVRIPDRGAVSDAPGQPLEYQRGEPQQEHDGEDRPSQPACGGRTHPAIIPAPAFRQRYDAAVPSGQVAPGVRQPRSQLVGLDHVLTTATPADRDPRASWRTPRLFDSATLGYRIGRVTAGPRLLRDGRGVIPGWGVDYHVPWVARNRFQARTGIRSQLAAGPHRAAKAPPSRGSVIWCLMEPSLFITHSEGTPAGPMWLKTILVPSAEVVGPVVGLSTSGDVRQAVQTVRRGGW